MDLNTLISLCKKEDRKSQKLLVERFAPYLFTVCRSYMRDDAEAKDVLQDTFVSIFKNINQIDENDVNFKAWCRKIAVNNALQIFRKKSRQNEVYIPIPQNTMQQSPKAYESLENSEVYRLVLALPSLFRQVFCLHAIDGYKHHEIAKMLDIKEGSSRSAYHRAKEKLKIQIAKNNELKFH